MSTLSTWCPGLLVILVYVVLDRLTGYGPSDCPRV